MTLSSTESLVEAIRAGRMVVLMDDEDRENEGDLVMAAEQVRPEDINFMARYGRGLICLTLTRQRCEQLRLPLMVAGTDAKHSTNFTVSIEAAEGVTTGISAADRARTVQAAVAPDAGPQDIVMPGHVFPLMAQPGGVLSRAGHTEAGCDLARLAGLEPASVIVEILKEDGNMARRPDLEAFCETHGLPLGTVADLIRYRLSHEQLVTRVAECEVPTAHGSFRLLAYQDGVSDRLHFAMIRGDIDPETPTLVRVHVENRLCDLLAVRRQDCGRPLDSALQRVATEGTGVVVVLGQASVSVPEEIQRLRAWAVDPDGAESGRHAGGETLRTYGVGAQILRDAGVRRMRVLGAPRRMSGISGFGLEVTEYLDR